jgi:hypothetical protein
MRTPGVVNELDSSRRGFFRRVSDVMSTGALAYLMRGDLLGGSELLAADSRAAAKLRDRGVFDLKPRATQHAPKAQAVIQLFMNGGPSQMDLFDPKPMLTKHHGDSFFNRIAEDLTGPEDAGGLMGSPFRFQRHGEAGIWVSEVMPHLAGQVDEICVVRSMQTTHPNHEPALYKIHSGQLLQGQPAMGAWVTYGLGSENQNLPAYVVLDDPLGLPVNGIRSWQAGYLPPIYQGTRIRSTGSPILNLHPAYKEPAQVAGLKRALIAQLDRVHQQENRGYLDLDARIASYELAARMQLTATEALDLSGETESTLATYGVGSEPTDSYARRCLMARRLIERGVRFVQLFINGQIWDHHAEIEDGLKLACARTDQPVAALLADLKQRGLLDSTLVLWGGEFGRTPTAQLSSKKDARAAGRDHSMRGFSLWMAGGGVKPGTVYGTTDDFGFEAVENPVSVADWHATILHLLGLDHAELFYEKQGLRNKLTGVEEPRVVKEILLS